MKNQSVTWVEFISVELDVNHNESSTLYDEEDDDYGYTIVNEWEAPLSGITLRKWVQTHFIKLSITDDESAIVVCLYPYPANEDPYFVMEDDIYGDGEGQISFDSAMYRD